MNKVAIIGVGHSKFGNRTDVNSVNADFVITT